MASIGISFNMDLKVYDEEAFRKAARDRALEDGLTEEDANRYLDEESMSLSQCAVMLLDPGTSPKGAEILGSGAECNASS